jgi:hypothetical protein
MRHAAQQDLPGALHDLETALSLHALGLESRATQFWVDSPGPAPAELIYVTQEVDLPPASARNLIHLLSGELSLSLNETAAAMTLGSAETQAFLDRHYTDDGRGNGWLVVSTMEIRWPFLFAGTSVPRSKFWNLFSPAFNDRRTVAAKLTALSDRLREFDRLDYPGALAVLRQQRPPQERLSILDGPLVGAARDLDADSLRPVFAVLTWRRPAVVMVALSAYKHDHGVYPADLGGLVPEYLDQVPNDLVTNAPFVYTRTDASSYELRCADVIPPELALREDERGHRPASSTYSVKRPAAGE